MQVEPVPRQKVRLPEWVLPCISIFSLVIIFAFPLYKTLADTGIRSIAPVLFFLYLAALLLSVVSWVLGIAFAIYIFNWLRETRVLLRQIELNTRASQLLPKPLEQKSEPPSATAPQDAKYMPKL